MNRFDKITGLVGNNNYELYHSHKIDVSKFTDTDIDNLIKKGYKKRFGYVSYGSWSDALYDYKLGKKLDEPDPNEIKKQAEKGFKLQKIMIKSSHTNIDDCQWIDDIIDGVKEIVFYFQYDRFSKLPYQRQILKRNTFITYRDVLNFVDSFYDGYLTKYELENVKDTDDCFGYSDIAKDAYNNNTKLKRKDIMGDCCWFEGFTWKNNGWELDLGS